MSDEYLLLTKFENHTVSYEQSFFPSMYGSNMKHAGYKWKDKRGLT